MDLKKTLKRLESTEDGPELRRAARDVGHELVRQDVEFLNRFRAALAGLNHAPGLLGASRFSDGYREALLDVTAAFVAAVQAERDLFG